MAGTSKERTETETETDGNGRTETGGSWVSLPMLTALEARRERKEAETDGNGRADAGVMGIPSHAKRYGYWLAYGLGWGGKL